MKDRDSLEAWLRDQPREVAIWIAFRAAARVLPVWWQAVLTEDWVRENQLTALPLLRCLIIAFVAAKRPSGELKKLASSANQSLSKVPGSMVSGFDGVPQPYTAIAYSAGYAALVVAAEGSVITDAALEAVECPTLPRSVSDPKVHSKEIRNSVTADIAQLEAGQSLEGAWLWVSSFVPRPTAWHHLKKLILSSQRADIWGFWIAWYQALLEGRPMLGDTARTWEMLERIALIEPGLWDAGPEVVNSRINEIWELYQLRVEAAALRAEKEAYLAARATPEQRSHNNPPELVETAPEVARQVTIIWVGLDEAQEELEKDAPDKGRLRRIAELMLEALTSAAWYCARKADAALTSALVIGSGAFGKHVADYVHEDGRLKRFVKDLLNFAFGG